MGTSCSEACGSLFDKQKGQDNFTSDQFIKVDPVIITQRLVQKCVQLNTHIRNKDLFKCSASKKQTLNGINKGFMKHKQSGMVYEGTWNGDRPEGAGAVYFKGGQYYYGQIENGEAHGQGLLVMINGCCYEGQFRNNKAEGKGKYKNLNQDIIFQGIWKDSKPEKGLYYLPNSTVVQLTEQGRGKMKRGKNVEYEGQINQYFLPHGKGKSIFKVGNNQSYQGDWKNGQMHGQGHFIWRDSSQYKGNYHQGLKHGYGQYIYPYMNASQIIKKYIGQWKNGVQHGRGKLIESNNTTFDGQFKNGSPVQLQSKSKQIQPLSAKHIQLQFQPFEERESDTSNPTNPN